MSGSSSWSEHSVDLTERPSCKHGPCCLLSSFSLSNPGRRYWKCPLATSNQENNGCNKFVWYEDKFEGRPKMAIIDCIKKNNFLVRREKKKAEEELQVMKDDFEMLIKIIKEENRSFKKALKLAKSRLKTMYLMLFVSIWILCCLFLVSKDKYSRLLSLPL